MKEDTTNSSEQEKTNNILTTSDYYNRACKREALRDYEGAAKEYQKMNRLEPKNPTYCFELGRLYSQADSYLFAAFYLNQVIQLDPSNHEAYFLLSICLSAFMNPKGAILELNKAIKIKPDYQDAYEERGVQKAHLEDYKGAIKDYQKAIKINPYSFNAHLRLAEAKQKGGDEEGYNKEIKKSQKNCINKFEDIYNYAQYCFSHKKYGQVKISCNWALDLYPDRLENNYLLGELNYELKEYTEALTNFDTIINQDPLQVITYLKRGSAKLKLKDRQGAFADFKKALELDAEYFEFYFEKISSKLDAEEFAEEMRFFIQNFKVA